MSTARIKICGITSGEYAAAACAAGADAVGLMFYPPSSRHLELDQAAMIQQSLTPFVSSVAVMVNPDKDYVMEIINRINIDYLQFHGEENDEFCRSFGLPFLKAIRVADNTDLIAGENSYPSATGVLLDTHVAELYGGSGQSFDWNKAQYGGQKPVILAGGLTPENIQQALETGRPYGVDVSSGVETGGIKDPDKMFRFCQNVRSYL